MLARFPEEPPAALRRVLVGSILIAQMGLLALLVRGDITWSGNEATRFATVERVVEAGTFAIEGSTFETVDRVRIGGTFYSDKPLLLAGWLALLYWPLHHLGGLSFASHGPLLIWLLTLIGVAILVPVLSLLFHLRLRLVGTSFPISLLCGVAVVLTTWIGSFGVSVNNHTPAALALLALIMALERMRRAPGQWGALGAGALAGVLFGLDMPTGGVFLLVGGALLIVGRGREGARNLLGYAAGFGALVALQAGLHFAAFGSPLPAYLVPGAFDFPESIHTQRIAGLHRPEGVGPYLFHITMGARGVFSHMPVLVLGLAYLWSRRARLPATDAWPALGVLALVIFYGTQTGDYGGWAYGFRFLIPVLPLLFWWSVRWMLIEKRARLPLFIGLLVAGWVTSWVGALNPWPVIYEGSATAPSAVEEQVRSPFLANLLVHSFERNPEGPLFRWLAERVYGRELTLPYLHKAILNLRRRDLLPALRELARQWQGERPRDAEGAHLPQAP